jgi:predicted acylesterase/phospholipase RssA
MTIKHIVIGGGGTTGFMSLGALKCLERAGFWNIANIKSVYGTSIGSVLAVSLALKYDWSTLTDYYVRRPWNKLYAYNRRDFLMNLYTQNGIFTSKIFEETLRPLLEGKDLTVASTMLELFELTGIELHFFSLELNTMSKIDISHKTHPALKVTEAVYMSAACPILFTPHIVDKCCYVDGGLVCNYAVNECIDGQRCELDEVLGMRNLFEHYADPVDGATSVINYFMTMYKQITMYVLNEQAFKDIPNEVVCITDNSGTDFVKWIDALKPESIETLMNKGEAYAKLFMKYKGLASINRGGRGVIKEGEHTTNQRRAQSLFKEHPPSHDVRDDDDRANVDDVATATATDADNNTGATINSAEDNVNDDIGGSGSGSGN